MSALSQKRLFNNRSLMRFLLGIYFFPLALVCFSLSVPPADLPLCILLVVVAGIGMFFARKETQRWRRFWIAALILALALGALELVAGRHIAQLRTSHAAMPNQVSPANGGPRLAFPTPT